MLTVGKRVQAPELLIWSLLLPKLATVYLKNGQLKKILELLECIVAVDAIVPWHG